MYLSKLSSVIKQSLLARDNTGIILSVLAALSINYLIVLKLSPKLINLNKLSAYSLLIPFIYSFNSKRLTGAHSKADKIAIHGS